MSDNRRDRRTFITEGELRMYELQLRDQKRSLTLIGLFLLIGAGAVVVISRVLG